MKDPERMIDDDKREASSEEWMELYTSTLDPRTGYHSPTAIRRVCWRARYLDRSGMSSEESCT